MPLYEYECAKGHRQEGICRMEDRAKPMRCDLCGRPARLVISAVKAVGLAEERGYYDIGLGEYVKSKAHADEIGKRMGLQRRHSRTGARGHNNTPNPVSPLVRIGKKKEEGFNAY
jgi:putative FmdB family regulatory protein